MWKGTCLHSKFKKRVISLAHVKQKKTHRVTENERGDSRRSYRCTMSAEEVICALCQPKKLYVHYVNRRSYMRIMSTEEVIGALCQPKK